VRVSSFMYIILSVQLLRIACCLLFCLWLLPRIWRKKVKHRQRAKLRCAVEILTKNKKPSYRCSDLIAPALSIVTLEFRVGQKLRVFSIIEQVMNILYYILCINTQT